MILANDCIDCLPSCIQEMMQTAILMSWIHALPYSLTIISVRAMCHTSASSSRPCLMRCLISSSFSWYSSLSCRQRHQCALSAGLSVISLHALQSQVRALP